MKARRLLQSGLGLALEDPSRGRGELADALALAHAEADAEAALIAAAALVLCIGIADDHYAGFEAAAAEVSASAIDIASITDPDHRLLVQAGALVSATFRALDDPALSAMADTLTQGLGDGSVSPAVRCCAGLALLSYFDAQFDPERTLWLELAMRPVVESDTLGTRLAGEWRHALAQARYQCAMPAPLETADGATGRPHVAPVPAIALKQALVEAQVAIGEGRADAGRAALDRAQPALDPRAPRPASWWHLLRSRLDLLEGRHRQALTHARLALRLATLARFPERWMGVTVMQEGQIHMARGACLDAVPFFERAGRAASGSQADFCWCLAHFGRALGHFALGTDTALACQELASGLALARRAHWVGFFRASPQVAAQVCAAGLEHGIETAFVREVIAARSLDAVRSDLAAWPWPIRVRTLGRFGIELDGVALSFGGKVARKPLELLQFAVAAGGSDIATATVKFALWRDLEGDKAHAAFNITLHRLRKLLASDDAITLELGRLSLNPKLVWVDCLAFEQLVDGLGAAATGLDGPAAQAAQRAVALYGGPFLNDTDDETWQMAYRARLASKFKRTAGQLARHHADRGEQRAACTLLERALEFDPMAEDLARHLMRLLSDAGEQAAALDVFARCRAAIASGLGARPSAATLALVEHIRAMS